MKKKILAPITSLHQLEQLASTDPKYLELAKIGSRNLGGTGDTLHDHMHWLRLNVMEATGGDEQGVVDEVNFVRDLVPL